MRIWAVLAMLVFAAGCGSSAGAPSGGAAPAVPHLVAGPLPPAATEIGRVAGGQAYYCGALGYVDMGAAVDGPAYYFRRRDGVIVGRCGGYCMGDQDGHCRRECPPPSWTCTERIPERRPGNGQ